MSRSGEGGRTGKGYARKKRRKQYFIFPVKEYRLFFKSSQFLKPFASVASGHISSLGKIGAVRPGWDGQLCSAPNAPSEPPCAGPSPDCAIPPGPWPFLASLTPTVKTPLAGSCLSFAVAREEGRSCGAAARGAWTQPPARSCSTKMRGKTKISSLVAFFYQQIKEE